MRSERDSARDPAEAPAHRSREVRMKLDAGRDEGWVEDMVCGEAELDRALRGMEITVEDIDALP